MKPVLCVASDDAPFSKALIQAVGAIECGAFFSTHLGKPQHEQRAVVASFQELLADHLRSELSDFDWMREHRPNSATRDSFDIFGRVGEHVVVIELDKPRADQVAKKFVARTASLPAAEQVWFVSLCYPGTGHMNKNECVKYFGYCSAITQKLGRHYAGFIIQ